MKTFDYTINGIKYHVEVLSIEDNIAEVEVNGTQYSVEIDRDTKQSPLMRSISKPKSPVAAPVAAPVAPTAQAAPAATPSTPAAAPSAGGAGSPLQSPLPGVILSVSAKVGDTVKKGQKIMVLEAMKMENDIKAHKDGVIASISVAQGDSVQEGDTLATIS